MRIVTQHQELDASAPIVGSKLIPIVRLVQIATIIATWIEESRVLKIETQVAINPMSATWYDMSEA